MLMLMALVSIKAEMQKITLDFLYFPVAIEIWSVCLKLYMCDCYHYQSYVDQT